LQADANANSNEPVSELSREDCTCLLADTYIAHKKSE